MSQQIIEWSIDGVRVLTADSSGRVSQANLWSTFEHHDTSYTPLELGEKLKHWLNKSSISPGVAILVLPREMVVVRQLQLPQSPEEELPDLVKFQSAAKSSMPIDDLALDYFKIETSSASKGQSVLTTSIERKRLRRIKDILTAAGFEIEQATISPLSIGHYVKRFAGAHLGTHSPEMIIFQRNSLVELSIFDQGGLVFSHSMVLPESNRLKPLESGITRSIIALNQTHPNVEVARCFTVGSTADSAVLELLEKKFPGNVHPCHLPETLSTEAAATGYEPLIGAALPVANTQSRLDLLNPRKRIEKTDKRKLYWIGGATAVAVLFLLFYVSFSSKMSALQASIDSLNETISVTDRKLKAGEPQKEAFQKMESWTQGQLDPIVAWNQLRNRMPGTDRLYVSELRLQPVAAADVQARFTGVGFARQRNDVDNLYQQLAENGYRVTPQATTTSSKDPDYPVRFELNVDVLRPKEKDSKVTESNVEHSKVKRTNS